MGATTKAVEYQYDALGRRIGKSVDENGDGFLDRSQTFVYDGAGLLAASGGSIQISGPNGQLNQHGWVDDLVLVFEDSDGDGSASSILSSRLLYGPAVDQVFAQESAAADVLWALTDHQGTVRDWVESADFDSNSTTETEVINHLNFDAFGKLQSVTDNTGQPTTLDSRLTILPAYTGQLYDADAGLHYYKARWYDSIIGKFISEDPMGFEAGDVNVSRVAGNKIEMDPSGLYFQEGQETGVWEQFSPTTMIPPFRMPTEIPAPTQNGPAHPYGVLNPMTEEQVKHWEWEEKGREILESGRQMAHLEYALHTGARGLFYFGPGGVIETSIFFGGGPSLGRGTGPKPQSPRPKPTRPYGPPPKPLLPTVEIPIDIEDYYEGPWGIPKEKPEPTDYANPYGRSPEDILNRNYTPWWERND